MVTRHGWLNSSYYFFDMELCNLNLEEYIRGSAKKSIVEEAPKDSIFGIIREIASGLEFIHCHSEVHRDLKPRNGSVSDIVF